MHWTFLVFTASLLGAQHQNNSVKLKPASSLVLLQKALSGIFFGVVDSGEAGHAV